MSKGKYYILDMFPYPSGEGLHMGHVKIFTASDIYSRYKRMLGYDVLHPTGFDAFGLPAEQYAIKNKVNPAISTKNNCDNFLRQMKMMNWSYDYDKTISTTDPEFYKWTQWIFKQLYKKDLAWQSNEPINWCPSCKTGLANEDLEGNACERCGSIVEKKPLRQWVLGITKYADRLIDDLDTLDNWQDWIKDLQRNWIGRSEGSEIDFEIVGLNRGLTIFTTRADTIFGATFMAINYNIAKKWIENGWEASKEIKLFISDLESEEKNRSIDFDINKLEKIGINTDIKAINPANNKEIPIYIANYILSDYGTGAIMGVPAHDARDYEFAKKYGLDVTKVIQDKGILLDDKVTKENNLGIIGELDNQLNTEDGLLINSNNFDGLDSEVARQKITEYVGGEIVKKYKLKDWVFARQRYWGEPFPIVFETSEDGTVDYKKPHLVADSELPIRLPEVDNYEPTGTGESPLANIKEFTDVWGYINDDGEFESVKNANDNNKENINNFIPETGERLENPEYRKSIVAILYDEKTNKYLSIDWNTNGGNLFIGGGVDEGEKIEDCAKREIIEETGYTDIEFIKKTEYTIKHNYFAHSKNVARRIDCDGLLFKLNSDKRVEAKLEENEKNKFILKWVDDDFIKNNIKDELHKLCYKLLVKNIKISLFKRETNTMPQWAGSSWYWLRFMDSHNDKEIFSSESAKKWGEADVYIGGVEHATRHLIYGRFWHKFLYDIGIVDWIEPFKRLETVGLLLGSDGNKMSKRTGNIINPDDTVREYGADITRLYVTFIGPFNQTGKWDNKAIVGIKRFVERIEKLKDKIGNECQNKNIIHQTIKKVGEDIEDFRFNTAISQMMILLNEMESKGLSIDEYKTFIKILWPFAPEICDRLSKEMNIENTWPAYNENKILEDNVNITFQVNGKLRDTISVPINSEQDYIMNILKDRDSYKKYITTEPKKIIFVKNKIVNVVG